MRDYSVIFYFASPIHLYESVQLPLPKEWRNKNPISVSYPHQYILWSYIVCRTERVGEGKSIVTEQEKERSNTIIWKYSILIWNKKGEEGAHLYTVVPLAPIFSLIHWLFHFGETILCWDYLLCGWRGNWVNIAFTIHTSIISISGFYRALLTTESKLIVQ